MRYRLNTIKLKKFHAQRGTDSERFRTLVDKSIKAEEDLLRSEAKNRALLDAIPDLMVVINKNGRFLDFKPAKGYVLLVPPEDFLGANVSQIWPAELAERIMHFTNLALKTGETQSFEYELLFRGKTSYQEARLVVSGEAEVLILFRDITERRQMDEKLKFISTHDGLTGAYNRIFLDQEINRLNDPTFAPVGVIICDLDGLKLVNDSFGHDVGDFFLQRTANILDACFPDHNVVRIGEDEFGILFPNTSIEFLETAYQKIKQSVKLHNSENPEINLNMSSGYAITGGNIQAVRKLIKEAEYNMGREKLHRIRSTRSAIVQTLVKALEARDFITEGHGDRLQDLVEGQGRAMGLPEQKLADLRLLGQFHDIGKVGIPDRILFKPGRLTVEERIEIQRHCEIGHRIALSSPDLVPIAEGILKHHEWWDGSGYPLGLKGAEIPVECRILSIADAYDAMTNDRPYRTGMSHEDAATRLREGKGTQFDPNLVESFIRLAEASENAKLS